MDITFTNVLEGARQYFQGLPAATSSTGSPAVPTAHRDNDGSVHSEQHSAVPYWDHQNEGQGTHLTNKDVMNPHQNRTAPPQQPNQIPSTNYQYEKSKQNYNYPPTSQVSHLYQSHIPSSNSYYELQTKQQKSASVNSSQPSSSTSHPTTSTTSSSSYNYIQSQTHYPNYPSNSNHPPMSSSQSQEMQYNYKYQPQQQQQQPIRSQAYPANYYQQQQQQPTTALPQQQAPVQPAPTPQIRTTHRLPVVATEMYNRTSTHRLPQRPTNVNNSSYQYNPVANSSSAVATSHQRVPASNGVPYSDQYKYYQNTPKYSSSTYNTTTTTQANQYANNRSYAVDSRVNNVQRPPQPPKVIVQQPTEPKQATYKFPVHKPKRESPLDLSVKTVKSSADSTLHEANYDERNYRFNRFEPQYHHQTSVRAPKVDFLPNFNMPTNQPSVIKEDTRANTVNKYYYNYAAPTTSTAQPQPTIARECLPRIEFPALDKNVLAPDMQRKRNLEHLPSNIPEKIPKVDVWRQNIDQQIEQRLSSYTKSRMEHDYKSVSGGGTNKLLVNGNGSHNSQQTQLPQNKINMNNEIHQRLNESNYKSHSSTSTNYNYPQYPQVSAPYYNFNQTYQNQMKSKQPPIQSVANKQTANKKVLSMIRNKIEIKGAQKKLLEQQLQKQTYREIQQPSTDVMAPLQPKPGIVGRRNISPFTAVSLERNSNTPPSYKLHLPKAVDSVIFSDGEKEQHDHQASMGNQLTPNADLDGLAAFLAARIRTKAELKQVGTNEQTSNNNTSITTINSPIKLKIEDASIDLTPKKAINHFDESMSLKIPNRMEIGGIRSSSETSVFDFPDSDAETEMPVLEKQGLVALRKDRKTIPAQFTLIEAEARPVSPFDLLFSQTCDTFMEVLKKGCGKKRGRRKKGEKICDENIIAIKLEPDLDKSDPDLSTSIVTNIEPILIPLENIKIDLDHVKVDAKMEVKSIESVIEINNISDKLISSEIKLDETIKIKTEVEDVDYKINENVQIKIEINNKSDSDSDTPLIICKNKIKNKTKLNNKKSDIDKKLKDSGDSDLIKKGIECDSEKTCSNSDKLIKNEIDCDSDKKIKKDIGNDSVKKCKKALNSDSDKKRRKEVVSCDKIKNVRKALTGDFDKRLRKSSSSIPDKKVRLSADKKLRKELSSDLDKKLRKEIISDSSKKNRKDVSDCDKSPRKEINGDSNKKVRKVASKLLNENDKNSNKIKANIDSDNECVSEIVCKKKKDKLSDFKDKIPLSKPVKKPAFGDGSDFQPGWEEELYKYKKSLRMPRTLIQVTRPPNFQRLSTSLPDLDPCPSSPAPSSVADSYDYKLKKFKVENIDSDMDSNCSFNFSFTKTNYDSEEGSSVKSLNTKSNSILDTLIERYGGKKRKRHKKSSIGLKTISKSVNELLPKPSALQKDKNFMKSESVLLGFRKNNVNSFKDAFTNNSNKIVGINEFSTAVLKSRTRTETRVLKEKATIREVFGEDRPASAPPITCIDELKSDDLSEDIKDVNISKDKENFNKKPNELLGKLINRTLTNTLFNKIKTEIDIKKEKEDDIKIDKDIKIESPVVVEGGETVKKRNKLRGMRRKLSSGFDYIRKKKKIVKKEDAENLDTSLKPKRRGLTPKANPESIEDIQKEIKMWVLNKGVGETHLHRAARCGYTDITAYCLEKMSCNPSPKDNAGYTPLHEACSKGHLDIAKILLQYGAHVSESAQGGIRPLHEAAENGYVEIVRLLLAYGADPTLATYSGITPLQLAVDETTVSVVQNHLNDIRGNAKDPWKFNGPASCFDPCEMGYDTLDDVPQADSIPDEEDMELEISEQLLPNLYSLPDSQSDRWVLLQDLSNLLKIKSKETLLRQLNVTNKSDIVKEMKTVEFLEQARCCQFLNANEKLNTRASKTFLVKFTEKVKQLLNIEQVIINANVS